MKLYDLVKETMQDDPRCRESDKMLIWRVWRRLGYVDSCGNRISERDFLKATSPSSISRARRKVVELNPELGPVKTKGKRDEKLKTKGTFIFREIL